MFRVNTILRTTIRPFQFTTVQRAVSTTKLLPSKHDGAGESMKQSYIPGIGKTKKTCEKNAMEQFKQCSDGSQTFSGSNCKDAFTECSRRIENLEKQLEMIRQLEQATKAILGSQKYTKNTPTTPTCCTVKPPKKSGDKSIPYIVGLVLVAAGILYLWYESQNKKEEKDEKDEKKDEDEVDKQQT